jgi:hypothetical protein
MSCSIFSAGSIDATQIQNNLGFGIWDLAHKVKFGIWNLALSNLEFGF